MTIFYHVADEFILAVLNLLLLFILKKGCTAFIYHLETQIGRAHV